MLFRATLPFAVSLLLVGCQDPAGDLQQLPGGLSIDAASVRLGQHHLGSQTTVVLHILNRGEQTQTVELSLRGANATAFACQHSLRVKGFANQALNITFVPDALGALSAQLVLRADQTEQIVQLSGEGIETPDCDDNNPCTSDGFDLVARSCTHRAQSGSCSDNNACTQMDSCVEGHCIGQRIECQDQNACTVDTCDPEVGCTFVPADELCSDNNPCTVDTCDPQLGCHSSLAAEGTMCGTPNCQEYAVCIGGDCIAAPTPNGFPCDDGDVCTSADSCQDGLCMGGIGQPFGLLQPMEITPAETETPIERVLDVDQGVADQLVAVYYTQAVQIDVDEQLDCNQDDCTPVCGSAYGGGQVRLLVANRAGVTISDNLLISGIDARATIRDGVIYVAVVVSQVTQTDDGCDVSWVYRIGRYDIQNPGLLTQTLVVPSTNARLEHFDIAASANQVALASVYLEPHYLEGETHTDEQPFTLIQAGILLFSPQLAIQGETTHTLASFLDLHAGAPTSSLESIQIAYQQEQLNLAFTTTTRDVCDIVCNSECEAFLGYLSRDVLANPQQLPVLVTDHVRDASLATGDRLFGAVHTAGNRDMCTPDPARSAEGPGTGAPGTGAPGSCCAWSEQVEVFSESTGGISITPVIFQPIDRIAHVAAFDHGIRTGVVTMNEGGWVEAKILATAEQEAMVFTLDLPNPVHPWSVASGLVAKSRTGSVLISGVSDVVGCDDGDGLFPGEFDLGRRVVIAGGGCGVQF